MKQIVLTGADGFIGSILGPTLAKRGHLICPFVGDITSKQNIQSFVQTLEHVDLVLHFAGLSSPKQCSDSPQLAKEINTIGAHTFAEFIGEKLPAAQFVFASTGQVYSAALSGSPDPIAESSPIEPINLYAETKLKAEELLKESSNKYKTKVTCLRLFNHTHKTQAPHFFLPSLYQQILKGGSEITTGNLDLTRDLGAIQDLARALISVVEQPQNESFSTYNLCSGTGKNLKSLALELARQMKKEVRFKTDSSLVRTNEPLSIVGSCQKFSAQYGWKPQFSLNEKQLIASFLKDI